MDGDIGVLCLAPPFFLHDLRGLYASFLAYRILGLFLFCHSVCPLSCWDLKDFFPLVVFVHVSMVFGPLPIYTSYKEAYFML